MMVYYPHFSEREAEVRKVVQNLGFEPTSEPTAVCFRHSTMMPHNFLDEMWEVERLGAGQGSFWPNLTGLSGLGTHRVNGSQVVERQVNPGQVLWMLQQL